MKALSLLLDLWHLSLEYLVSPSTVVPNLLSEVLLKLFKWRYIVCFWDQIVCKSCCETKFNCELNVLTQQISFQTKPYGISVTLAFPPDTDTPGFANEQKTKPMETRLISETAGLIHPDVVAEKTLLDALVYMKRFDIRIFFKICSSNFLYISFPARKILQLCWIRGWHCCHRLCWHVPSINIHIPDIRGLSRIKSLVWYMPMIYSYILIL